MSAENIWAPVQSFAMGIVKVGVDAIKIEDSKEEEESKKDDDKQKSNGKDSES